MSPMTITFIIMAISIILMIIDKIPVAFVAICTALALCLTNVLTPAEAIAGFGNTNVILIGSFLIIGQAFFSTGLANDIASFSLKYAKTEKVLIFAISMVAALLSGFLSNTGVTAMLIPIVASVCVRGNIRRSRLMMPISIGAGVGGCITLIGTLVNVIANTTMKEFGYEYQFGMFEFTKIGLPLSIITCVLLATVFSRLLPNREDYTNAEIEKACDYSSVPKWKKYVTVIIMAILFIGMTIEKKIGIAMVIQAAVGASALVLLKIVPEKEAYQSINLRAIFILAGMLPLSTALSKTGAGEMIADKIVGLFGDGVSPIILMIVLYLVTNVLTQFITNISAATIMCPLGCAIAQSLNADPRAIMMAIILGASFAYATPLGMLSNTLVMGIGNYKFTDYVKVGVPLLIVSFVFCMILLPIFYPFSLLG